MFLAIPVLIIITVFSFAPAWMLAVLYAEDGGVLRRIASVVVVGTLAGSGIVDGLDPHSFDVASVLYVMAIGLVPTYLAARMLHRPSLRLPPHVRHDKRAALPYVARRALAAGLVYFALALPLGLTLYFVVIPMRS